jgi:hypothetical protein
VSHVALRVELSTTRLSAAFGQPALDYRVVESGWQDSNLRLRAPKARGFAATLHPVVSVRTGGLEPPTSWSPTRRDTRLRYVLASVARAGVEPASAPGKGAILQPIDERAMSARIFHAVEPWGLRALVTQWVGRRSNPPLLVFSQALCHLSYRPNKTNKKSPMSL